MRGVRRNANLHASHPAHTGKSVDPKLRIARAPAGARGPRIKPIQKHPSNKPRMAKIEGRSRALLPSSLMSKSQPPKAIYAYSIGPFSQTVVAGAMTSTIDVTL